MKDDGIKSDNKIINLKDKNSNFAEFLSEEFVGYPILLVQGAQLLNQVPGLEKQEYSKKIKQSIDKIIEYYPSYEGIKTQC